MRIEAQGGWATTKLFFDKSVEPRWIKQVVELAQGIGIDVEHGLRSLDETQQLLDDIVAQCDKLISDTHSGLVGILNSPELPENHRSETMLVLADCLHESQDYKTERALRWAEERGRWPVWVHEHECRWLTMLDLDISRSFLTSTIVTKRCLLIREETVANVFLAFQKLGEWIDTGFVLVDWEHYRMT